METFLQGYITFAEDESPETYERTFLGFFLIHLTQCAVLLPTPTGRAAHGRHNMSHKVGRYLTEWPENTFLNVQDAPTQ